MAAEEGKWQTQSRPVKVEALGRADSEHQTATECIDHIKGRCSRGGECRYVHNKREQWANEVLCIDFSKGGCSRGGECRYVHNKREQREASEVLCIDFSKGDCSRGVDCRYVHKTGQLCKDHINGVCSRGEGCHHSHAKGSKLMSDKLKNACKYCLSVECKRDVCRRSHAQETIEVDRQGAASPWTHTALAIACAQNDKEAVSRLIAGGADVNERGPYRSQKLLRDQCAPLHIGVRASDATIVQLLLSASAEPDIEDETSEWPLYIACKGGQLDIAELLIAHQADVNKIHAVSGSNSLFVATQNRRGSTIRLLVAHGASPLAVASSIECGGQVARPELAALALTPNNPSAGDVEKGVDAAVERAIAVERRRHRGDMAEVDQQHREELSEVRRQHREDLTEVSALFETQTATLHETIAGLKRDLHVAQRLAAAEQLEGMEDDELDAMEALVREERRRQLHVRNSAEIAAFSPPPYCAE